MAGNLRLMQVVVKRITVIEFGENDVGGNSISCGGIKVRTDTTTLSNMVVTSVGDGRNLKPRLRAEWVVVSVELCILPISNEYEFSLGGIDG